MQIVSQTGPFDIYISSASGSGTLSPRFAQLNVPSAIPTGTLAAQQLSLQGDITPVTQAAGSFGSMTGVSFFQWITDPASQGDLSVQGSGERDPPARPLRPEGQRARLVDLSMANQEGLATFQGNLKGRANHAVAAISLSIDGQGQYTFSVNGPDAKPVGVGMVPDPLPPVPDDNSIDPNDPDPPAPANTEHLVLQAQDP